MERYKITYGGRTLVRFGDCARDAVERLCDQYGWRCCLCQYDVDTRGQEWAECGIDTDGGINFDTAALSERLA